MNQSARLPEPTVVTLDYQPRFYQSELHEGFSAFRNSCVIAHRRAGKTVATCAQLIRDVIECQLLRPRAAYIAPTYRMAKSIAWDYFKAMLAPLQGVKYNVAELTIDIPGDRRIVLSGSDNPDRLRGQYFDACAVDEFADCAESLIPNVIRPALADRHGSLYLIGTVRGHNHLWETYEKAVKSDAWYTANLLPDYTKALDADELAMLREEMGPEAYRAELLNDPDAQVRGAFYARTLRDMAEDGRITRVDYDPNIPVNTAWDLGINDATAIWFIQELTSGEHRVIDYEEHENESFVSIIQGLQKRDYIYGDWVGPFDLDVREYSTGATRREAARDIGVDFTVAPRLPVADGIEATRRWLQRAWFDESRTEKGRRFLTLYRAQWDEKRRVLSRTPIHDECSHGADALRYYATSRVAQLSLAWDQPLKYNDQGII